jgi:hypothetical protein
MKQYKNRTKRVLEQLLEGESCGNIFEALSDIFKECGGHAAGDATTERECRLAESAFRVLAFGVDTVVRCGSPDGAEHLEYPAPATR